MNYFFSELIKVFDGYNSLRKRLFRTITVNKYSSKEELLASAMKAFVVSQVGNSLNINIRGVTKYRTLLVIIGNLQNIEN